MWYGLSNSSTAVYPGDTVDLVSRGRRSPNKQIHQSSVRLFYGLEYLAKTANINTKNFTVSITSGTAVPSCVIDDSRSSAKRLKLTPSPNAPYER